MNCEMGNYLKSKLVFWTALPMNLPLVAAEVTRRTLLIYNTFRLLATSATVQGFKALTLVGGNLTPHSPQRGEFLERDFAH